MKSYSSLVTLVVLTLAGTCLSQPEAKPLAKVQARPGYTLAADLNIRNIGTASLQWEKGVDNSGQLCMDFVAGKPRPESWALEREVVRGKKRDGYTQAVNDPTKCVVVGPDGIDAWNDLIFGHKDDTRPGHEDVVHYSLLFYMPGYKQGSDPLKITLTENFKHY
ncbi:uncharacterized protein PFL1_05671 [Pseudozyma flocculosa PF-1]|uniref:Uncharacterized protein n=2 Tax=Pseudozyma flocculosa TaxID=84751 RepID=A0A5C3F9U5_9BASI|nr:uncharacterized protein PFL1_05671 [Pseudozyma flocculosa PF-1]EPQ26692.1 hypothetical protein PFL1_05671 [Pseudozyma flocculosa PF-1]SPO40990.1 uncharacterized protein PSFLO_06472 [Pseudozyma flocculosa]